VKSMPFACVYHTPSDSELSETMRASPILLAASMVLFISFGNYLMFAIGYGG
jgi:hypothetical protein